MAAADCLSEAGITLADVDEIAFNPAWPTPSDICTDAELIAELLDPALFGHHRSRQVTVVEHHLAHAGSAFHPSGFDEAAVLVVDGSGDGVCATLAHGTADGLKVLRRFPFSQSLGWFYETVAEHLGLGNRTSSGKLMGLTATAASAPTPSTSSPPAPAAPREGAERRHRDGRSGTCHHQPGPGEGARRPCPGPAGAPQPRLTRAGRHAGEPAQLLLCGPSFLLPTLQVRTSG
ncbi:carbamoyltransferase N-terminal domain-containing protein [Streptomyces sp. NPDC059193]|uniref:carbamoyltransferase N-terminal domain-containing protein n=1 Tax=Streptomyces sp. NPDC059193 TaxID=3346763 RepID=UPI0036CBA9AA